MGARPRDYRTQDTRPIRCPSDRRPPPRSGEIALRVRYAECDPMGYVHHSKYFEYFEMGRSELLRLSGIRYRDLEERGQPK